jgi:hypothetical protein
MKKLIILSLILLFSCGKESSVNEKHHPRDWDYDWKGDYDYSNYPGWLDKGQWPVLNEYWTLYNSYSFYYTRYNCASFVFQFCSYQTVGQGGKEFFNVFSKISSENRHPYGNTFGKVIGGLQLLFTPVGATAAATYVDIGVAENGLTYWLYQSADGLTKFGINPAYPIWANPVFQEETINGTKVGYYLSHWLYW